MRRTWIGLALAVAVLLGCTPKTGVRDGGRAEGARVLNAFAHVTSSVYASPDWRIAGAAASPRLTSAMAGAALSGTATTLVLFDDAGAWGWLGELYAISAGNLASHFGRWTAKPIGNYQPGDMSAFTAVIYIGSTYDQPVPTAFLDDVLSGQTPVIWIYDNVWQLVNHSPATYAARYGFTPWIFDTSASPVTHVVYKGTALTRSTLNGETPMTYSSIDPARSTVLATAVRSDGSQYPWAIRSSNLTYVGEIPFAYINETDRYLVFCDLLFDVLAPGTPERHRALVRIEDVNATSDPNELKAIADYLRKQNVPFSVAVIPYYSDPLGAYSDNGQPEAIPLKNAPEVVAALKYMQSQGGTLLMHGYTHQHSTHANPYSGASADDFEFWLSHIDDQNWVRLDGPVPEDSATWTAGRISAAFSEFAAAGLPSPTIFEYPHYAGSGVDSRTIQRSFGTVYHRGFYFSGGLSGADNPSIVVGQFFPYAVRDVYGWVVVPENIGNYEPLPANNIPPRLPSDLLANTLAAKVVRDGFASFYFHPYYPVSVLKQIVQNTKNAGYTFVSPGAL